MDHEQRPAADEGHRQRRAHARPLGVVGGLLEQAGVGLAQRVLEVLEDGLLVGRLEVGEALQEVQDETSRWFPR